MSTLSFLRERIRRFLMAGLCLAVCACDAPEPGRTEPAAAEVPSRPVVDESTARLLEETADLHRQKRYREGLARLEEALRRDPGRPLLHYNLGVFKASLRDFEGAAEAFEEELARDPGHRDSHRALATAYTRVGRLEDSVPHFQECLAGDPDDDICAFGLGTNLATLGRPEDARPHLEHAARLRRNATAWAELGLLYRQLGDLEAAVAAFRKALADDPSHLPTLLGYGQILTAAGRAGDGAALLERHQRLSALQDQLDAFERARRQGEPPPGAYFELARLHLERGDRPAAASAYERSLELDPQNPVAALELADLYLEDGLFDDAERAIEMARSADPGGPAPLFLLGLLRLRTGDAGAASETFASSQALGPWPPSAHVDAGFAYLEAGEPERASPAFAAALELDPENPDALYGAARARYLQDDRAGAEAAARQAVVRAPDHSGAWALLGSLRFDAGDPAGAAEAVRRVAELERLTLLGADGVDRLLEDFPGSEESRAFFRRSLIATGR